MNIISILENRRSVRKYSRDKVNIEELKDIITKANNSNVLDENAKLEFRLVENGHDLYNNLKGNAGYLGNIIDAPHYVVALTNEKGRYLENLGYRMEQLMIEAQNRDLGTCWIELFHGNERVNDVLEIENGSLDILTITPIGFEKVPLSKRIFKSLVNMKSERKPYDEITFFDKWKYHREPNSKIEEKIVETIKCAKLAPSWGNNQPWRFFITENKVLLFSHIDKVKIGHQHINHSKIDCGIIMFYFELLGEELGLAGKWSFNSKLDNIDQYNIDNKYEYIGEFIVK